MYTPLQIEIIKRFGKKELTEGCIVETGDFGEVGEYLNRIRDRIFIKTGNVITNRHYTEIKEILGHIPEIFPDVARVAENEGVNIIKYDVKDCLIYFQKYEYGKYEDYRIPYNPTLPLLDQDESTLTQLLTLFNHD